MAVQASTPDSPSAPVNETATGWLYQPPASAGRAAWLPATAGGIESYLSANERFAAFPAWSWQAAAIDAVAESGPP